MWPYIVGVRWDPVVPFPWSPELGARGTPVRVVCALFLQLNLDCCGHVSGWDCPLGRLAVRNVCDYSRHGVVRGLIPWSGIHLCGAPLSSESALWCVMVDMLRGALV